VEWTSIYKTGIDFIDEQHKRLFDEITKLKKLEQNSRETNREVYRILNFLEEYIIIHFSEEEAYMDKIGYDDIISHKSIHSNFIKEFDTLKNRLDSDGNYNPVQLFFFLIKWLQQHIAIEDQKYVNYQSIGK